MADNTLFYPTNGVDPVTGADYNQTLAGVTGSGQQQKRRSALLEEMYGRDFASGLPGGPSNAATGAANGGARQWQPTDNAVAPTEAAQAPRTFMSGDRLISRDYFGAGHPLAGQVSYESSTPMDPQSIAMRLRAGGPGRLQQFMPQAMTQYNDLLKSTQHNETLKAIEAQKAQIDDKRIREAELRQDKQLGQAQSKQEEAEEARVRMDTGKEYIKNNPQAQPADRQRAEEEAGTNYRKSVQSARGGKPAVQPANATAPPAAKPANKLVFNQSVDDWQKQPQGDNGSAAAPTPPIPKLPPPDPLQQADIDRLVALTGTSGNLNLDELLKQALPEFQNGRITPEVATLLSRKLAARAGGDQQLMEAIGPRLAASERHAGRPGEFNTAAGKLTLPQEDYQGFWGGERGTNVALNGQKWGYMPNRMLQGYPTGDHTATNQLQAELLAWAARNSILR